MSEHDEHLHRRAPSSPASVGLLVAFLDSNRLEQRRHYALRRLRELQASESFASLPDDLQQRIHEILDDAQSQPSDS